MWLISLYRSQQIRISRQEEDPYQSRNKEKVENKICWMVICLTWLWPLGRQPDFNHPWLQIWMLVAEASIVDKRETLLLLLLLPTTLGSKFGC